MDKLPLAGPNGGAIRLGGCLKNPKDIVQDLINAENNPINVDLTFRKKIKVILVKI